MKRVRQRFITAQCPQRGGAVGPRARFLASLLPSICILFGALACTHLAGEGKLSERPKTLAGQIMDAMGGERALRKLRFLHFEFVVRDGEKEVARRAHLWDRHAGRYRLEMAGDPERTVILFNVNTKQGRAYRGSSLDSPAPDQRAELESAYAAFINDTYWLLAATKLRDPGTHLEYVGAREVAGRSLPTLELSFDEDVGLTPKDRYWFHVDPETRRPLAWSFVLKGRDAPPTGFRWSRWQRVGALHLPTRFEAMAGATTIDLERLYSPSEVEDRLFEIPGGEERSPLTGRIRRP